MSPSARSEATTLSESTAFFGQPKVSTKNRGATARDPTGRPSIDSRSVIEGLVEPGFERVADAFARQLRAAGRRRRRVLRLRRRATGGGHLGRRRRRRDRAGRGRTTRSRSSSRPRRARPRSAPTCSSSAGCSTRTHRSPTLWPEFAANGKERHPGALRCSPTAPACPSIEGDFTLDRRSSWDPVVRAARRRQPPRWEPGTAPATTSARTAGSPARSCGGSPGAPSGGSSPTRSRRRSGSTGGSGSPRREEPRVATLVPPPPPTDPEIRRRSSSTFTGARHDDRATRSPGRRTSSTTTRCGTPAQLHARRAAVVERHRSTRGRSPACTPRPSARSTARRLLEPATVARPRPRSSPTGPTGWSVSRCGSGSASRWPVPRPRVPARTRSGTPARAVRSASPTPSRAVGFGYVMNQMEMGMSVDERASSLAAAVYACLDRA